MIAGRLRHPMELQTLQVVRAASGKETETWLTVDSIRASIEPLTGREQLMADQVQGDVSHRVRTRYRDGGIQAKQRLRMLDGTTERIFNIVSARTIRERRHAVEILCNEEVS